MVIPVRVISILRGILEYVVAQQAPKLPQCSDDDVRMQTPPSYRNSEEKNHI